jgi:hypothetical protein
MRSDCIAHRAGRRVRAIAALAVVVPAMALALASPALAGPPPQGIFKIFTECPYEDSAVEQCLYAKTTSGEFSLGADAVPITKTLILQAGLVEISGHPNEDELIAATDGETLSKTELSVPGGLSGLVACAGLTKPDREQCETVFEDGYTSVTATLELAASAKPLGIFDEEDLSEETGAALTLPARIHLKNVLLGNSCYVGSAASPIALALTTGETDPPAGFTPIEGAFGTPDVLEQYGQQLLRITEDSLVENDFSEPGAEGCGEYAGTKGFLDSTIDAKLKLPDGAGYNTASFDGELNLATSAAVIASK